MKFLPTTRKGLTIMWLVILAWDLVWLTVTSVKHEWFLTALNILWTTIAVGMLIYTRRSRLLYLREQVERLQVHR